ncbi:MAG: ABC transporter permease subunit [Candidatus Woesearchaeota archaeon]|nr:MAG: ABC transporter permease subunit [Candidatus Woesearchaeota archaeon]
MRFQVIMSKTLKDLFSIKRSILFLITITAIPLIGAMLFMESDFGELTLASMTLAMQNQMVLGFFMIMSFMWIAGIPLVLLAIVTCGDSISKEQQDGTLLVLVSKPVRRYEIVIGKFLAFIISAILLEVIALLISALVIFSVMDIDIFIFNNILGLMPSVFFYSLFVVFIFGAIATGFSSLFKNRIKTIITLAGITILIFFGFMVIRTWTEPLGIYEDYGLNNIDVNYHLGNSYVLFIQSSGTRIMPIYQGILGTFTGTYDATEVENLFDDDIGAMPPSLEEKDYTSPPVSMLIWIILASLALILGILKLERKEIT